MSDIVTTLPLSDFTPGNGFEEKLYDALVETGFVILTDHGVDLKRLHETYATVAAFYAQPEEEKRKFIVGTAGQRGYTPFGRENAKGNPHPDLKEFWHVGRDEIAANVWPDTPEDFRASVEWMFDSIDEVGMIMLRALTRPLDVPSDYFETLARGGNSILRLLHYPPIPEGADPNCVRAAAHEDINLITLLVSASASGLQLLDRDGEWREIDAPPDSIIVDAGDMLARITNNNIPATTHRVVNPEGPNVARYSMPFFLHPKPGAMLSCLSQFRDGTEAEDITADDFLKERLAEIGLM
ncbi:MAG: isopenicillin N synthase family dioxygenase [Parvularcula sp.]